ncbi:MAG: DUF3179 domain-containing (seleno)protein [Gemmataceae bacterium]
MLALFLPLVLASDPIMIEKPDAFPTLVNPNCSHCVDEAKRRKDELKNDDPVLWWTRGYSDGGAIPLRFFLNQYRVISDSYGVFVYDPDAGYARGFAPSYNFVFHGWRNGIMVMKDKSDGTLYSCLSGEAFAGPRKGHRLTPIPTMMSTWGTVMERNPNAVAYHMFEKYKPSELPKSVSDLSLQTQPQKFDPRLKADQYVLGVRIGTKTKAFLLDSYASARFDVRVNNEEIVVINDSYNSAAAYKPIASQPRKWKGPNPNQNGVSPEDKGFPLPDGVVLPSKPVNFRNYLGGISGGNSEWRAEGRGLDGDLKGWTLEPVDCVVCKWSAWSTEYPDTEIEGGEPPPSSSKDAKPGKTVVIPSQPSKTPNEAVKEVAGTAEFLRLLPKPFAIIKGIDPKARTVALVLDGEKEETVWPVEADAEIKIAGWWGRLEQFNKGDRVWVWLKLNRDKKPVSIALIADELSEQVIHNQNWKITEKSSKSTGGMAVMFKNKLTVSRDKQKHDFESIDSGPFEWLRFDSVYVFSEKGKREWITDELLALRTSEQKEYLCKHWRDHGLPGTVTFVHVFSGEMDVMLDHEAMRWGRSLQNGDKVELTSNPPIKAVVKSVTPWRERTQLRLVVGELQSTELGNGQRIGVKMNWLSREIDESKYPTDIGRTRTKAERIEWFLASMYCVCGVGDNICTGDYYTLASCNPNGCGAPNAARKEIGKLIDAGKTDTQIWDELVKDRGIEMTRPHLRK